MQKNYYTYILASKKNGTLYIGVTMIWKEEYQNIKPDKLKDSPKNTMLIY